MSSNNTVLEVNNISIRFGGVQAVDDLSFEVAAGELLGLIGPNGAGKTTCLSMITGKLKPDTGRVILSGQDVTGLPIHNRIRSGLAMTHQIVKPFRSMTVLDNVVLAAGLKRTKRPLGSLFQIGQKAEAEAAREILDQVGLAETAETLAEALPLGQLKRLEVARALALKPKVVLFDEPLAGLNEGESETLVNTIVELNKSGLTVVLVEHNLGQVLRVSRRLLVLDNGRLIADGDPDVCMANHEVRDAYIGSGGHDADAG